MSQRQAHITMVNGVETSAIALADRGLSYGDGIFETMRVHKGTVPLLPYHLARFEKGIMTLALGSIRKQVKALKSALNEVLPQLQGDALIKVILTRGAGGRGYTPPTKPEPNLIVQVFDFPETPAAWSQRGIDLVLCQHRLSAQPALAGIKHLNRLDQVLASAELGKAQEGLMRDQSGTIIEGTKSNLLVFTDETVLTPMLDQSGITGTQLQYLLDNQTRHAIAIEQATVDADTVAAASGLAMVNSVLGLLPVKTYAGRPLVIDSRARDLARFLNRSLGFSLAGA